MSKIEALKAALDEAADAVSRAQKLIADSGLSNPSAHTLRIGAALANIFEINAAIDHENLDPSESQVGTDLNEGGFNRELGDLLIHNQHLLANNNPHGAIENAERFIAASPPEHLRRIAECEISRIRGLFNV